MSDSYDDYEAGVHSGRQFARAEGRELPLPDQPTQSDNTQPNSKIDPKTRISNDVVLSDNTLDDLITTCDFKPDETGSRICYWCGERKGSKIHTLKAALTQWRDIAIAEARDSERNRVYAELRHFNIEFDGRKLMGLRKKWEATAQAQKYNLRKGMK